MTKIDARSNPVTIAHVDDVAEWSKLLGATRGAGFRHQSSGVGSNPTIITKSPRTVHFVSVAELV